MEKALEAGKGLVVRVASVPGNFLVSATEKVQCEVTGPCYATGADSEGSGLCYRLSGEDEF